MTSATLVSTRASSTGKFTLQTSNRNEQMKRRNLKPIALHVDDVYPKNSLSGSGHIKSTQRVLFGEALDSVVQAGAKVSSFPPHSFSDRDQAAARALGLLPGPRPLSSGRPPRSRRRPIVFRAITVCTTSRPRRQTSAQLTVDHVARLLRGAQRLRPP